MRTFGIASVSGTLPGMAVRGGTAAFAGGAKLNRLPGARWPVAGMAERGETEAIWPAWGEVAAVARPGALGSGTAEVAAAMAS